MRAEVWHFDVSSSFSASNSTYHFSWYKGLPQESTSGEGTGLSRQRRRASLRQRRCPQSSGKDPPDDLEFSSNASLPARTGNRSADEEVVILIGGAVKGQPPIDAVQGGRSCWHSPHPSPNVRATGAYGGDQLRMQRTVTSLREVQVHGHCCGWRHQSRGLRSAGESSLASTGGGNTCEVVAGELPPPFRYGPRISRRLKAPQDDTDRGFQHERDLVPPKL